MVAVPRSGEPNEISTGTTTALAVASDGTLYAAGFGSRRAGLSFIRDNKEQHILDYSARFEDCIRDLQD
ncbi:MAG: hypothetical protein ACRD0C_02490 [Acidimicrobiia bacterium]